MTLASEDAESQDYTETLTRARESLIAFDAEVFKRYLVTKDRAKFAVGKSIKYLEILHDGKVRVRDAKTSHLDGVISDPSKALQNVENSDKVLWEDKKKNKSRQFKFSTAEEKKEFFEELKKRDNKDKHKQKTKDKHSVESFKFLPHEEYVSLIYPAIVRRRRDRGDESKWNEYTDKLVAITNYRIVVVETYGHTEIQKQLQDDDKVIAALEVVHMCVMSMECAQDMVVTFHTKDLRTVQLDLSLNAVKERQQNIKFIKQYIFPTKDSEIFAFAQWSVLQEKAQKERNRTPKSSDVDVQPVVVAAAATAATVTAAAATAATTTTTTTVKKQQQQQQH
ncbi:hypothetical protein RFI_29126, partial [Reticulomyxa filosa]